MVCLSYLKSEQKDKDAKKLPPIATKSINSTTISYVPASKKK